MEKLVLKCEKRDASEIIADLRASKVIPGVVYGKTQEAISIKFDNSDLLRTYRVVGKNDTFNLDLDGKTLEVSFKEVQLHPVTDEFLHIDLYVA